MLQVRLFGPPEVVVDGRPIEVDTRKAIALLAYVVVEDGPQSRDRLTALLWPEYDQERARAAFRRTLSVLRRALGGRWLLADRTSLRLEGPGIESDVGKLLEAVQRASAHDHSGTPCPDCTTLLAAAAPAATADFMSGFSLRDSPEFEEWQQLQAESLRRVLARALEGLVQDLAGLGELERAIATAHEWLRLDPLHEPAHRSLMQLYAWAGDRNAALEHYRDCVALLDRELGVAPLPETTEIYEAVREQRLQPPPAPAAAARTHHARPEVTPASRFPLVGRAEDFQTLWEGYAEPSARPILLAIEGEAGIGKTALAGELAQRARAEGGRVAMATCFAEERGIAYGPVAELVRRLADVHGREMAALAPELLLEASRLVPELSPEASPPPPAGDPGAPSRFFEGLARCLAVAYSEGMPGMLVLDDVHRADEGTLDLLSYLMRRIEVPLRLVLTWRSEDVPASHRLHRLLAEAGRDGRARHRIPGRLQPGEVAQLVQWVAPAVAAGSEDFASRLYEETEGVPYFVAEYLAAARQRPEAGWDIPTGVRDLVLARVQACSELARQVLGTAAVIGRSFDFDTVCVASGRTEDETVDALEELGRRLLVVEVASEEQPSFGFAHEKVRHAVYNDTSFARRRILHGRVAEALSRAGSAENAAVVAHHLRLAGRDVEAARWFAAAGERAASLYANQEARGHLETALALGHSDVAALHEALGDLELLSGRYREALNQFEVAAAVGGESRRGPLERKLAQVHRRLGDWKAAESHLASALDALREGPGGERSAALADYSIVKNALGDTGAATQLAHEALEVAFADGDPGAIAQARNILGILAKQCGDLDAALGHLEESLAMAEQAGEPQAVAAAMNNLALTMARRGDLGRARALAEQALALCVRLGDRHREAALHNNLADMLHALGGSDEAMWHLKAGATILAEVGEPGVMHPEVWKLTEW